MCLRYKSVRYNNVLKLKPVALKFDPTKSPRKIQLHAFQFGNYYYEKVAIDFVCLTLEIFKFSANFCKSNLQGLTSIPAFGRIKLEFYMFILNN